MQGDITLRWKPAFQEWEVIFEGKDKQEHSNTSDTFDEAILDIITLVKMMS